MTITNIDIYRLSIKMEPFVIATGTMHFAQNVFIKIDTSAGITGVGECSAFPMIVGETQDTCLLMARDFAKIWKGKDPLAIDMRMTELDWVAAHNNTIKSAFNMALYDVAAKAANLPLYQFLGGERRSIETDVTIGIGTPEKMAEQSAMWQSKGATMLKIKLGKGVDEDMKRIQAVRKQIGSDIKLRVDANQGWSENEAAIALDSMKDLAIEFCEQPMRAWYDDKLPALTASSPIAVMADESCYNHHDARRLINSKSCDYINIKFAKSGGISEAIKIHDTCLAAGMACMIGSMLESRLALTANVHFAYASPNLKFFDLDTCLLGQLEDPVIGGVTYKNFFLEIDDSPGIGAHIDEKFLEGCEHFQV